MTKENRDILKKALSIWQYFPCYTVIYNIGESMTKNQEDINAIIDKCAFSINEEWFRFHYFNSII